jgi:hypothetical protein
MKKICSVLLAVILAFAMITPVFAGIGHYGLRISKAVEANEALILPAGTWVYGMKVYADAASSFMGVYNSATMGACTNDNVIGEVGEATQYDTETQMFPVPIFCSEGVSVVIGVGVGFVFYGSAPN